MIAILVVIEALVVFIAFLYLVHLVSHIRNILRIQLWDKVNNELGDGAVWSVKGIEFMRARGALTREQAEALKKKVE